MLKKYYAANPDSKLVKYLNGNSKLVRSSAYATTKRRGGGKRAPASMLGNPTRTLAAIIGGFPQTQKRTLNYFSTSFFASLPNNTYTEKTFVLNGLFSVDAGAAQPQGFGKYMLVYQRAYVTRARWRVDVSVATSSGASPPTATILAGATITTNATSLASATAAVQNGLAQYGLLSTSPDQRRFGGSLNVSKFMNKPILLDDFRFANTVAANPSELVVLHVWALDEAAVAQVDCFVMIEFDVTFCDPIPFT